MDELENKLVGSCEVIESERNTWTTCFKSKNVEDLVASINNVLSEGIEKIDATKYSHIKDGEGHGWER